MYQELGDGQIQLVSIEPGDFGDPIHCSLQTVSLSSNPKYNALSYYWEDFDYAQGVPDSKTTVPPKRRGSITFDGMPFVVKRNLEAAQRHIRQGEYSRTLWIDALCIDQMNDREKAKQIAMMGDIYAGTAELVTWAGTASPDSALALGTVRRVDP